MIEVPGAFELVLYRAEVFEGQGYIALYLNTLMVRPDLGEVATAVGKFKSQSLLPGGRHRMTHHVTHIFVIDLTTLRIWKRKIAKSKPKVRSRNAR